MTLAFGGCGMVESEPPPCRAGIPAENELLRSPAFESLTYHRRSNFDVSQGAAFDLWADSKFEYKAAVEFSLVPSRKATNGLRFCVDGVSIRLALPLDEPRQEMLRALVRSVTSRTALRGDELQARLDELVVRRVKYRPIAKDGSVSAEAGTVSHPYRGDLFVVAFIWQ